MTANPDEIERRKQAAIAAIRWVFGTSRDEDGATLFVSHHLSDIEQAYWLKHLGTPRPEPIRVLDILVNRVWDLVYLAFFAGIISG